MSIASRHGSNSDSVSLPSPAASLVTGTGPFEINPDLAARRQSALQSIDNVALRPWRRVVDCFLVHVAPRLYDQGQQLHWYNWLTDITTNQYSVWSVYARNKHKLSFHCASVVHNITMCAIRTCTSRRDTLDLRRLSTIVGLMRLQWGNTTSFRKHVAMLRHFSMDHLLDNKPMRSVYLVLSTETKHSYVGLTGRDEERLFSARVLEHLAGGESLPAAEKDQCKRLYTTLHNVGTHRFFFVPCDYEAASRAELERLETYWIRRLIPSMNTAKLPRSTRRKRHRPNAHKRRDFEPAQRVQMSDVNRTVIPRFSVNILTPEALAPVPCQIPHTKSGKEKTSASVSNLFRVFEHLEHKLTRGTTATVRLRAGNLALTQTTQLNRTFGRSRVELLHSECGAPRVAYRLKAFLRTMRKWKCENFTLRVVNVVRSSVRNSPHFIELYTAVRFRTSRAFTAIMREYGVRDLLKMWSCISHLKLESERKRGMDIVKVALRRFGVSPMPQTVLALPHRDDVVLHATRYLPNLIMDKMDIPAEYRRTLKSEFQVTPTSRPHMRDLLINYRKTAKAAPPTECTCELLREALHLDEAAFAANVVDGHLAIRATDCKHVDELLRCNLTTIPFTDGEGLKQELTSAVNQWVKSALPFVQQNSTFPIEFRNGMVEIFDPAEQGTPILASVTEERFARWHAEYNRVRTDKPNLFKQCHGTNFVNDVVRMVRVHAKDIDFDHWVNHPPIYQALCKALNLSTEYFSSPLNFNLCHKNYFSEHSIDRLFGSQGNAWTHRWDKSGTANPIYTVRDILKTLAMAYKFTSLYSKNGFVLTIPLWESKRDEYFHLLNHEYVHPLAVFDEHAFAFHHPRTSVDQQWFQAKPPRTAEWRVAIVLVRKEQLTAAERTALGDFYSLLDQLQFPRMSDTDVSLFLTQEGVRPLCEGAFESIALHAKQSKWTPTTTCPALSKSYVQLDVTCARFGLNTDECLATAVEKCQKTGVDVIRRHRTYVSAERMTEVRSLCKHLKNIATIFEIDKNSGCALFACKQFGVNGLNGTFRDDPHYAQLNGTDPKSILKQWRRTFNSKKWRRFGNWRGTQLPYCYAMPKNKDIRKWRPIVSYCVHPMRVVLQRAGRALSFMLKKCGAEHFTLHTTQEFVPTLKQIVSMMHTHGFDRFACVAGDIKQMYTELPHDFVLEAVDWLIQRAGAKTRRSHIAVPRRGNKGIHFGIDYNTADYVTFDFATLRDIVAFDLNNATFTQGETLLSQKVGIPMGSPMSPALAIIMCAYCEYRYLQRNNLQSVRPRVFGVRYVDDAYYLSGYHSSDPAGRERAQAALDDVVKNCYHKNLVVETDPDQTHICMLESIVDLSTPGELHASYWHKNAESIRTSGTQSFLKFQPFASFSPLASKKGVITSTFLRVRRASSDDKLALRGLGSIITELRTLAYPKSVITSVLQRMTHKYNDNFWGEAVNLLNDVL